MSRTGSELATPVRRAAVAGSFYPGDPVELRGLVMAQLASAPPRPDDIAVTADGLAGILVPHAGLVYSGHVAAVAWGQIARTRPSTIVLLGTNHRAGWLDGVGVWDAGIWRTPMGDVSVDADLAAEILELGAPFVLDRDAHRTEHSLEIQLPFVVATMPRTRIVPIAVSTGTGRSAVLVGERLGSLLARRRAGGDVVAVAISTDMAHYPPAGTAAWVTDELTPFIVGLRPADLADAEAEVTRAGLPGVACGMCGIEPAVVGCAALRAMGASDGIRLAAATSAEAGGGEERTVGYLSVAFPA
jgi:hypothetical protein